MRVGCMRAKRKEEDRVKCEREISEIWDEEDKLCSQRRS